MFEQKELMYSQGHKIVKLRPICDPQLPLGLIKSVSEVTDRRPAENAHFPPPQSADWLQHSTTHAVKVTFERLVSY